MKKGKRVGTILKPFVLAVFTIFSITCLAIVLYTFDCIYSIPKNDIKKVLSKNIIYLPVYVYDGNQKEVEKIVTHPINASLKNIPEHLIEAFVAEEDKDFWKRNNIDYLKELLRLYILHIEGKDSLKVTQTSITQKLIELKLLKFNHNFKSNIQNLYLSWLLEHHFSKEKILEEYLSNINFGNGIFGVENASHFYFKKNLKNLSLLENAALVAIAQSPSIGESYPDINYIKVGAEKILNKMLQLRYITLEDYNRAKKSDIAMVKHPNYLSKNYNLLFLKLALKEAVDSISQRYHISASQAEFVLYRTGIKIYTALDEDAQDILRKTFSKKVIKGAGILVDYKTGAIEGLVDTLDKYLTKDGLDLYTSVENLSIESFKRFVANNIKNAMNNVVSLNILSIYSSIVNNGLYIKPHFVLKITDYKDNIILETKAFSKQVVDKNWAISAQNILKKTIAKQLSPSFHFDYSFEGFPITISNSNLQWFVGFLNDYPYALLVLLTKNELHLPAKFSKYNPALVVYKIVMDSIVKRKILEGWHYYQQHAIIKNSKNYVFTPTKDKTDQATHPDILYFANGFHGFKYWLACTPYPFGNAKFEEPFLLVSNDGKHFEIPKNINDPLVPPPADYRRGGHYSDTDLIFDGRRFILHFVYNKQHVRGPSKFYRIISYDGIHWSTPQLTFVANQTLEGYSPAYVIEGNTMKMWYIGGEGNFVYTESFDDEKSWQPVIRCNINMGEWRPWHVDVIKTDVGYEGLMCARSPYLKTRALFYIRSKDGINWEVSKYPLLFPSKNGWDRKEIYRSTMIKEGQVYKIWYAARGKYNIWHIGYAEIKSDEVAKIPMISPNSTLMKNNHKVTKHL